MEECYFCNSDKTDPFAEHYILCKKCSAIYTFNNMKGLKIPLALRLPQQELLRKKPAIFRRSV